MHRSATALFVLWLGVVAPHSSFAHHSRAAFDMSKEAMIEGTVAKLDWMNPHIYFTVETRDARGEPRLQEIEATSVSEAAALGLRKEAIAPGTHVLVRVNPNRQGAGARASGLDVRTSDGTVYPLNVDAKLALVPAIATTADGLAGRWAPTLDSFNGIRRRSWPLTEAGRAAQTARREKVAQSPELASFGICEPLPPPLQSIFPDLRTIEIGGSTVVMRTEGAVGVRMERVVHLDQSEHPANVAPSMMGHSIGRWEGQTLVIDTVAFEPSSMGLIFQPSSSAKHLVERLSLAEDRRHLQYTFTLEDREFLAGTASYTATWDYRPDLEPTNVPCDPETARRFTQR